MIKKKRRIIAATVCIILLALLCLFAINENANKRVVLTSYTFENEKLPKSFDGYKIMVISDIHEADFAEQIKTYIESEKPNVIAFTGDMAQLPDHEIDETLKIATSKEAEGALICAVSGNHETQGGYYEEIKEKLKKNGVAFLDNKNVWLEEGGEKIRIIGVKDPETDTVTKEHIDEMKKAIEKNLHEEDFSILLMHRANLYPEIKNEGADLILSGHLHGGVIRLPFVGGLVGRGKNSLLPEYEYGFIKEGSSSAMIVSGGCDKNPKKKRVFNPPEVVLITLKGVQDE